MLYAQHTQILKHSSLLLFCAIIAFCIGAGTFVGMTFLALMDPSGVTASLVIIIQKVCSQHCNVRRFSLGVSQITEKRT